MLPTRSGVLLVALASVFPSHGGKLTGAAFTAVDTQCRTAALAVGEARAAGLEVTDARPGTGRAPAPSARRLVEWRQGPVPGRFVAVVDATRAGRAVTIRATVDARGGPCRLVAWRVV